MGPAAAVSCTAQPACRIRRQQLPDGPGKDFDRLTPVRPGEALYGNAMQTGPSPVNDWRNGTLPEPAPLYGAGSGSCTNSGLAAAPLSVIFGERAGSRGLSEDRRY